MAPKPVTKAQVQRMIDRIIESGWPDKPLTDISTVLNVPVSTLSHYVNSFARRFDIVLPEKGLPPLVSPPKGETHNDHLFRIKTLETQLAAFRREELTTRYVRSKIMGLAEATPTPPDWLVSTGTPKGSPGVPSLFCSDWHWAEVINPEQIGGVNEYSLDIAHARARLLITQTIDLLKNHMVNAQYPGIVMLLGGDMFSGNIHDELVATNEEPLIPALLDLLDVLIWCIKTLADTFGNVFLPCVTGNHSRTTHKIQAKDRAYTNFDWLLYQLLDRHFADDPRVTFLIPDGPDALFRVYNHRYLLSHGDQFRGGDGLIGALGPIIRGDMRKRSRNNQIDRSYDVLCIGHWHQLIQMQRVIVNGSLCGYNEYASSANFPFERPRQALWITHKDHGITFSLPVNVSEKQESGDASWVSLKAE